MTAAGAVAAAALVALAGPSAASARGCGSLPVTAHVKSKYGRAYALQYKKKLPIELSTRGPRISGYKLQLYTFGGFRLGRSHRFGALGGTVHRRLKLKYAMQPGQFTLVVKGTVAGCGELEYDKVLHFRSCASRLPINFPDKPRGKAADYGNYVSVKAQPTKNQVLHKLTGRLYSFGGRFFGSSKVPVLFGREFFNNELVRPLRRGNYTFIVSGFADQPKSCGRKSKQITLRFR